MFMLILLFVVSLALCFIFAVLDENNFNDWFEIFSIFFGVGAIVSFIALIVMCIDVSCGRTINERIQMYTEQNQQIESDISELVENYMEYESSTFTNASSDSAITLVSLYPELKSDALVEQQCDLYMENNRKITELKEEQINLTIYKWWLYFGK